MTDPRFSAQDLAQTSAQLRTLAQLDADNRACVACALRPGCAAPVPGEWLATSAPAGGIVLIAEAPGSEDDRQGRPLVGPAGQGVRGLLAGAGLGDAPLFLTTLVKCRPPLRRPATPAEAQTCAELWLWPQLRTLRPRVVLTLGNAATRALLGTGRQGSGVTRLRGRWQRVPLPGRGPTGAAPVLALPLPHPATLARDEARAPGGPWDLTRSDLRAAAAVWRGEQAPGSPGAPAPEPLF